MQVRLATFASLLAFVAVAVQAAPMPEVDTLDLSIEAREVDDFPVLEMREFEDAELDLSARDFEADLLDEREVDESEIDSLSARDFEDFLEEREVEDDVFDLSLRELLDELDERGLKKKLTGLLKVPKTATFKTGTAKYSGDEVNAAAKSTLKHVKEGTKDRGYPKPGSGFRKSEAKKDPTRGKGTSFHAPLRKKGAPYPGPDRVIVQKKNGSSKWKVHVAHHDPKNPIPKGTGAKSHPFSGGKAKHDGKGRQGRRGTRG